MFFRALIFWRIQFSREAEDADDLRKRKIRNYFFISGSPSPILEADRRCWRNVECFWNHRGRKEGLDNAGWSGRSYIVLLVVLVLSVDDGQMNGLSMLATMFSRLDVPNCDLVFMRLRFLISSTGWYRRHFSFLSSPLKPKRSSTILLFSFFFSWVQHEWMCKKNVESSFIVSRQIDGSM